MILSLLMIALVGGIGYAWLSRGAFSALINLACVITAGAIAFAAWEPLSYALLDAAPREGFFSFVWSSSWAIGLLVPYMFSLAILRLVTDQLVPKGLRLASIPDMVGSAGLGAAAGVITAGMLVISVSTARLGPKLFGYEPMEMDRGSVVEGGSLLLPVDRIVAGLYGSLATGPFASDTPLGKYYPDLVRVGASLGTNHGDGKAVQVMPTDGFRVTDRYTVGGDGASFSNLIAADAWYDFKQEVKAPDGGTFPPETRLEGVTVSFDSAATESGQVVLSAAQVRLLSVDADGDSDITHPIAVVTLSDAAEGTYARFRYDGDDAVSSKGGGTATMAFEFPVRPGYTPQAIIIKNIRKPVEAQAPESRRFAGALARDGSIRSGQLMGGGGSFDLQNLDRGDATRVTFTANDRGFVNMRQYGITVGTNMPRGLTMQKGDERTLRLDGQLIAGGEAAFDPSQFQREGVIARELRVNGFSVSDDVSLIQIDVAGDTPQSFLSRAVATAESDAPPTLLDAQGRPYEAIGYVYRDDSIVRIRYTPDRPISGLAELRDSDINISRNTPGQELLLLFRVTRGVEINAFTLGNKVVAEYEPPIVADDNRR